MENFGNAFVGPLAQIQKMEIDAAKAPVELEHMQALTRLNKAQAGALEMSQQLQTSGMQAMQGFEFDKTDPAGALTELGARLTKSGQYKLAEQTFAAAGTTALRMQQAETSRAAMAEKLMKRASAANDAMNSAYGNLPTTDPAMLQVARMTYTNQMAAAGWDPKDIEEGVKGIEEAIQKGGPSVVDYLYKKGTKTADLIRDAHNKQLQKEAAARTEEEIRRNKAAEQLGRDRLERLERKDAADKKAGPTKLDPVKIDLVSQRKAAEGLVEEDPLLKNGDPMAKRGWAAQILQAAVEKVEASRAERARNPAIPIKSMDDAMQEALVDKRTKVKVEEPTGLGRLFGKPKTVSKPQERQPKPGAPDLATFLGKARAANPGVSDDDLKKHWESKYAQ